MKNILLFNYGIDASEFQEVKNGISFFINYDMYYFLKICRVDSDIELIRKMLFKNSHYHKFIENREGKIVCDVNGNSYVLLKLMSPPNVEVNIQDILAQKGIINGYDLLRRDNWGHLWSEKVDYLEYQISEMAKDNPIVRSSFSYYVGLAENAISLFNNLNISGGNLVVAHRRIFWPNNNLNFYNPLGVVVDYKVRDVGEYIKTMFFNDINPIGVVKYIVDKEVFSFEEYELLFARLLFPSYYFDTVYNVIENGEDEEVLLKYISKSSQYEEFLGQVYDCFCRFGKFAGIDWLIKKDQSDN